MIGLLNYSSVVVRNLKITVIMFIFSVIFMIYLIYIEVPTLVLFLDFHSASWVHFVPDQIFQLSVGIPMVTDCAPLLADLFLYSYKVEFVQKLLRDKKNNNLLPCPSTAHIDISLMSHQSAIIIFMILSI
jgi:hypothetical protein